MKKIILSMVILLTAISTASAMSYEQARDQALFLTDKMAYELNLNEQQYEAAYEINLDYLMGVETVDDVYALGWRQRNIDMQYIMYDWQYTAFCAASYFFRPLYWNAGFWEFGIYAYYPHRTHFYFSRPACYVSYRGGHSWRHNGGISWYSGRGSHYRVVTVRESHRGMRDTHHIVIQRNGGMRHSGGESARGSSQRGSYDRGTHSRGTVGGHTMGGTTQRESSTRTTVSGQHRRESSGYIPGTGSTGVQRQPSGSTSSGQRYQPSGSVGMQRQSSGSAGRPSSGFGATRGGGSQGHGGGRIGGMSGNHGGRR